MNLRQKKMYRLVMLLSVCMLMLFSADAMAVPSLGVATYESYATAPGDTPQDYQDYFVEGNFVSGSDANHGFALGPSGSELTIFTNILEADIYLLTDTDAGFENSPTFGGSALTLITYDTGQADGYKLTPYYALNLGTVQENTTWEWELLTVDPFIDDPFNPGPFYKLTATIEYSGTFPDGSYLFAAADENMNGELYFNSSPCEGEGCSVTDPFSPKTASTTPIPEMQSVYLFGMTLIGLVISRRKIKG
jgi:hypothetical protein